MSCPSCGAQPDDATRFCTSCGAVMDEAVLSPAAATSEEPVCLGCGCLLAIGDQSCVACGHPTGPAPPPPLVADSGVHTVQRPVEVSTISPPSTLEVDVSDTASVAAVQASPLRVTSRLSSRGERHGSRKRFFVIAAASVFLAILVGISSALIISSGESGREGPPLSARPSVVSTPKAAQSQAARRTAAVKRVRCWDGSREAALKSCSRPRGLKGLRWVFPRQQQQPCVEEPSSRLRLRFYDCQLSLSDGTPVTMHYTEWTATGRGISNYRYARGREEERFARGVYGWTIRTPEDRTGSGRFKAAFMYQHAPYSVTLYAGSAAARVRAIKELLELRPTEELRGVS